MPKLWRIAPHDAERVAALERAAGVPLVVAKLLLARGIADPSCVREFLEPKLSGLRDPLELPGVGDAANLIVEAVRSGRRITIYGDYDADGMTSTAILWRCLTLIGAAVDYYVPHRIDEGYGLNGDALRKLASQGADVVVTVDCGIASPVESRLARELGLTLIVTDHHQFGDELPTAAAIVHPSLPGAEYPFRGLCGAGVAFKLAWAICQRASGAPRVSDKLRKFLLQAVGLAAVGTVADVMPLVDENRILVRHGLEALRQHPTIGGAALLKVCKLTEKERLEGEDLAFAVSPRLNAAGRLGQAEIGVELLTTESTERAEKLAQYLEELNLQRQSLERSMSRSAEKQVRERFDAARDSALVVADHDWHAGVVGIVAGRLTDKYQIPAVVIALDPLGVKPGIGSARGVDGFDLHQALLECSDVLEGCGGHAAAAGLKIHESKLAEFRLRFCELARKQLGGGGRPLELQVDAETALSSLTRRTVEQLECLAPFGHGNARPVLCASNVRLAEPPRRIGSTGRHLSMTFDQAGVRMRAVAFGGGEWESDLAAVTGELSIAFQPVINRFRGRVTVEIHLADWRQED